MRVTEVDSSSSLRPWLAVVSVAIGTFALVTSELMPVGLLTQVASDLGMSVGTTGLMVTVPGLVAAFAAPVVVVAGGRIDRRLLLWILSALLIASNLIVALAPGFTILLIGRILLGIGAEAFGPSERRWDPDWSTRLRPAGRPP